MRSRIDAEINRRGKQRKATPPPGGKALQRLFIYLAQRDPALNNEIVATIAVPRAARPKFGLTKAALRARVFAAPQARRARRTQPAAKSFAATIVRAATALTKRRKPRYGDESQTRIARVRRDHRQAQVRIAPAGFLRDGPSHTT